jgi:hypothetical protein
MLLQRRVSLFLIVIAFLIPRAAPAQETDTEKAAARDVLKKMAALEESLDVPGLVATLTGPSAARDEVVARAKALMDKELLTLADDIATPGDQVRRAISQQAHHYLRQRVQHRDGNSGLSTAFVASRQQRHPHLGIIVEYDAARIGRVHGDQHSAQGPVGLAAASRSQIPESHAHAGQRHGVWRAGRGDDAAQREDRDASRTFDGWTFWCAATRRA